ncbi:MAG: hypothetical protein R2780_10595 [Crocinitomicaceae bacterium]|nr:hypothetical protein [Crocinitomicaceae bacterium]
MKVIVPFVLSLFVFSCGSESPEDEVVAPEQIEDSSTLSNQVDLEAELESMDDPCDLMELDAIVPIGGLIPENLTKDLMGQLVEFNGGNLDESSYLSFVEYGDFVMIIHDQQDGDNSELSFYSLDRNGCFQAKNQVSGVFEWFEGNKKYTLTPGGEIYCKPGSWKLNEKEGMMMLNTVETNIWIDGTGQILIAR